MTFKTKILKVTELVPARGETDCIPGVLVQEKDDKGKPTGPTMVVTHVSGQDILVNYEE